MKFGIILTAFVFIIIGVNLVDPVADFAFDNTNTYAITNETLAGVNGTAVTLANDDLVAVSAVRNASAQSVVFNETTDYTVNLATGAITVLSGTDSYSVDYTYYPDLYVKDATSRTFLNLIPLFFVILIFGGILYYTRESWMGLMGKGGL